MAREYTPEDDERLWEETQREDEEQLEILGIPDDELFAMPWPRFAMLMRKLNSQGRAPRCDKWLAAHNGWGYVPPKAECGDISNPTHGYCELKTSFLTGRNKVLKAGQCRMYQVDVEHYYLLLVENDRDQTVHWFTLTKDEMAAELAVHGSKSHGTKATPEDVLSREDGMAIPYDKDLWHEFRRKYKYWVGVPS